MTIHHRFSLLRPHVQRPIMPRDSLSFFDEKRSVIKATTDWGCWWQTVQEVHIQVRLPEKTPSKEIRVSVEPKYISCKVKGVTVLEGKLSRPIYADEVVWTIEEGNLCIVLAKSDYSVKDDMWESLLDGEYQPDPLTLHEMRKHLDLERFQIENPGMDFSRAQLSKHYDKLPGWSNDRLKELKIKSEESQKVNEKDSYEES